MAVRHALAPAYPTYVVDVSRRVVSWRWQSVLVAPVELLVLTWSVAGLILLVLAPLGLLLAGALWLGRLALRL